jgi:hypothetical protein
MKYNRGTELEIDVNDNLNVVFGTIDKHTPKTIYIRISGWGNPIDYDDEIDYSSIIRKYDKRIKTYLYKNSNLDILNNVSMVDMDMRESGITQNKSSFMSCEITLFQKNLQLLTDDTLNNELIKLSKHICDEIINRDIYFKFFKKKANAKEVLNEA